MAASPDNELAFFVLPALQELAKKHKAAAGDPFDLSGDILAARALRDELLTRADKVSDALLIWADKESTFPPKSMADLGGYEIAQRLFGQISKLSETQLKREKLDSLSKDQVSHLFTEYGELPGKILTECLELHLPNLERSKGAELVGDFTRKIAEAWQSLAAGA